MDLEDYTIEELITILRGRDVQKRAAAAVELGQRNDTGAVESLIRACNEDPDGSVRKAARSALDDLLGTEAELAISAYGSDAEPDDAWIRAGEIREKAVPWNQVKTEPKLKDTSFDELIQYLRGQDSQRRAEAAVELGSRHDTRAVEFLIRSFQEDPNEDVQDAAYEALEDLLGTQAKTAIEAFESDPETDGEWIIPEEEPPAWEEETSLPSVWDEEDLVGFISVLRAGGDPAVRVRAIQELKTIRDMRAVDAIALTAVWSNDETVQSEAQKAMEDLFGDETERVMASYQQHGMLVDNEEDLQAEEDGLEPEEDGESSEIDETERKGWISTPAAQNLGVEPVIKEEKAGMGAVVLIGVILLALIVYLLLR
jgi:HEAT repeat protein